MTPYVAYFLGLMTFFVIFIPFWVLSMRFTTVANTYKDIFCNQALA